MLLPGLSCRSYVLELGVALDELLRAAPGKADGKAAIFILAFYPHNRADAVVGMAHSSSQKRICLSVPLCSRPGDDVRSRRSAVSYRLFLFATDAAKKFLPRIRVFWIGLVAANFADLRHRATNG